MGSDLTKQVEDLVGGPPAETKQSLCNDILLSGFINAYVEFFHLTHGGANDEDDGEPMSIDELVFVKQCLIESEVTSRQGNSDGMYTAYSKVARRLADRGDAATAIYFFEKCLEIAQITSNAAREGETDHFLGLMFERLHDGAAAIRFHDCHMAVAKDTGDQEGVHMAGKRLTEIYRAQALELQDEGKMGESIESLRSSLDAALAAEDLGAEAIANHQLGVAYSAMGDAQHALSYLNQFLSLSRQTNDRPGEALALGALGRADRALGNPEGALEHMSQYLEMGRGQDWADVQKEALGELASIYSQLGDFPTAADYLARSYDLARRTGSPASLDLVSINLGVAKGNAIIDSYITIVQTDLPALLQWHGGRTMDHDQNQSQHI